MILSLKCKNAPTYLTLATYTEQNPIHPDIFYDPNGWNGYKYWMVFTLGADFENPYIIVSNDGQTWQVPPKGSNPIDIIGNDDIPTKVKSIYIILKGIKPPEPTEGKHFSDTCIFKDKENKIWIVYRYSNGGDRIYGKYSSDGITWSNRQSILQPGISNTDVLSPNIILQNSIYWLWVCDESGGVANLTIKLRKSSSLINGWSSPVSCSINLPSGVYPWHINVKKYYDEFHMIVTSYNPYELYFATSKDGINWQVTQTPFLQPKADNWDSDFLYQSVAIPIDCRTNRKYALWYTGVGGTPIKWHIGYTEIFVRKNLYCKRKKFKIFNKVYVLKIMFWKEGI